MQQSQRSRSENELARSRLPLAHAERGPDGPLQIGWRRRWIVISSVALCLLVSIIYLQQAIPIYTCTSRIYVQKWNPMIMTGGPQQTGGADSLYTQISLIASEPVVKSAIQDPRLKTLGVQNMKTFEGVGNPEGYLKKALLVDVGKRDNMITVSLDSPNAEEAAMLVNCVVDAYVADQSQWRKDTSERVLKVLNDEKAEQEIELKIKEEAMLAFKEKEGSTLSLASGDRGNIVLQKLARLSDELTQAQIETMYAKVEYAQSNAKAKAFQLLTIAELKEQEVRRAFDLQQKEALDLNKKEIGYARLASEVERTKRLVDILDSRIKEVGVNDSGDIMNVRVLEPAKAHDWPSKPEKARILGIALVLGLMLGMGLAYVRERTDHRLTSIDEISATLGLPVLGVIPRMPGRQTAITRGQKVHLDSMSEVAEAFRTLRTVVYFGAPGEQAKTMLITSPFQSEGKSTTASGLAIAMAKAGRRTLLIDADLRKPSLHRIFETNNEVGLSGLLIGKASLDQVIQRTAVEGLELLPSGPVPLNPSELLNSPKFSEVLEKLSARFDHILLDSPPVLPVSDPRILGAICDMTILVLRAGHSTRKMSEYAASSMVSVGARILGVVVNDVPRRNSAMYSGFGYPRYGYGNSRSGRAEPAGANGQNGYRRLPRPTETA